MQQIVRWRAEGGFVPARLPGRMTEAVRADPALAGAPFLLLLPPLWDHHGHVAALGALLCQADLRGARSPEEALERLRTASAALAPGAWLEGFGWDQNLWEGGFPHRTLLDDAFPDRPVFLRRIDGHAAWVSSAALRAGDIGESTPDPPGGLILRENEVPTGLLVDAAMEPVARRVPPPVPQELRRWLRSGLGSLRAKGLCGATDMGLERAHVETLRQMEAEGDLPIPLDGYLDVARTGLDDLPMHRGPSFRVAGAKLYADGALGSRGACLEADYDDAPGERGLLIWEPEALHDTVRRLAVLGLPPAIHAIGDRAARIALDALHAAGWPSGSRIEHAQLLPETSIRRMREGGVIASIQPCHYLSDSPWAGALLGVRMTQAYRWGSLLRAGIPLLLGTDFPIEDHDPLRNLRAALTREPDEERLTLAEALRAYAPPPGRLSGGEGTVVGCLSAPEPDAAGWLEGAVAKAAMG
ncbi:MAG: amidohydrolase [Acidobacteriota bacterium]